MKVKCLIKGCKKEGCNRGLCSQHHGERYRKIKRGKATWAFYEQLGEAIPPKQQRKKRYL